MILFKKFQVLLEKYGDCSKFKFKRYPMGDTVSITDFIVIVFEFSFT